MIGGLVRQERKAEKLFFRMLGKGFGFLFFGGGELQKIFEYGREMIIRVMNSQCRGWLYLEDYNDGIDFVVWEFFQEVIVVIQRKG